MKSSLSKLLVVALVGLLLHRTAVAQELALCPFLDKLVDVAMLDFAPLRGEFDFETDEYSGKLWLTSYRECHTSTDDGLTQYHCRRSLPDDAHAAKQEWTQLAAAALACFSGRSRHTNRGERYVSFSTRPHGATVTARYQRLYLASSSKPAFHSITIQVTAFDPHK